MEVKSFLATLTTDNVIQVYPCDELPYVVHAMKADHEHGIEIFFAADMGWTPEQEAFAHDIVLKGLLEPVYA